VSRRALTDPVERRTFDRLRWDRPRRPPAGPLEGSGRPELQYGRWEIAGYCAIAACFALLLWWQVRSVNSFYLDEWIYVGAAQEIWKHLPGGLVTSIPGWDRGVQRAYSTLLAPLVGSMGRSSAYTAGHVVNVLLLAVATVPAAALLARRVIASPVIRVLAVGLAVVLPWTMIAAHLLTESLAYPLFLWACLAIVRASEEPRLGRQLVAVLAIAALAICRLDLGAMAAVLVFASLGGEWLRPREERPLRLLLRRQAPILALLAIGIAGTVYVLGPGSSSLGRYGTLDLGQVSSRLFGAAAGTARHTALSYTRSLALGTCVLPFTLGLAAALAGVARRFGRQVGIMSFLALGSLVAVVGVVTLSTAGGALEERYVFYAAGPLALLAGVGVERARSLWPWAAVTGAAVGWVIATASGFPALDSGNFFAAPSGAFWTRVMTPRLLTGEHDVFGWLGISPRGWLLIAAGLALIVALLALARRRPRPAGAVLTAAAAACLAGQAIILSYSLRQELHGTVDRPGGIADGARDTFVDGALSGGGDAAVVPAALTTAAPEGGADQLEFWNGHVDTVVALGWNGSPVPASPGTRVLPSNVGRDGLARLAGPPPQYVAAEVDDPRVQFAARLVRHSPKSGFGLFSHPSRRALWTASGLDADGAAVSGRAVRLTVDRAAGVRAVRVSLMAPTGAGSPVKWRISARGSRVASGSLPDGAKRDILLQVPSCRTGACGAWSWRLSARGPSVPVSLPVYGAPPPARPVMFWIPAVRLEGAGGG
jgi:hypothetical protein